MSNLCVHDKIFGKDFDQYKICIGCNSRKECQEKGKEIENNIRQKEEQTYSIAKSTILAIAAECPTAKKILMKGFPEAFKGMYFSSGALFFVEKPEDTKSTMGVLYFDKEEETIWIEGGYQHLNLFRFVVLIHENTQRQYRLVHLATGYRYNKKTYTRTEDGIEIPLEDLAGLTLVWPGGASKPKTYTKG